MDRYCLKKTGIIRKHLIYLLVLVLILLSSNPVLANDCQYKTRIGYVEYVNAFYEDGMLLEKPALVVEDITDKDTGNEWTYSFLVRNNYHKDINFTANFTIRQEPVSITRVVEQKDSERIKGTYTRITGEYTDAYAGFNRHSLELSINQPENLKIEKQAIEKEIVACRECPEGSGKWCVNDGEYAPYDARCGSGKRNKDGICTSGGDAYEPCPAHYQEGINSTCVPDKDNPPEGMNYCAGDFKKIRDKKPGENCTCSFECKQHYFCYDNKCKADRTNPEPGKRYCEGEFRLPDSAKPGDNCSCHFECINSLCLDNHCLKVLEAGFSCRNTSLKQGSDFRCLFKTENVIINKSQNAMLEIRADGLELISNKSTGLGVRTNLSELEKGIELEFKAADCRNTTLSSQLLIEYQGNNVSFRFYAENITKKNEHTAMIHVYCCGDGKLDPGENRQNCCADAGVTKAKLLGVRREVCIDNQLETRFNWMLILGLLIIITGISLFVYITTIVYKRIKRGVLSLKQLFRDLVNWIKFWKKTKKQ